MARSLPVDQPATLDVDHFAERYALHEVLGQGGMAKVHRASDRMLGRDVALKQLTVSRQAPEYAHLSALFEREFHILAQLSHPHVIEVFDYGLRADGTAFYTMDLLDGGDLRDLAPLPWREACRLMFDVCSALALVHSRHLVHRDVTPRNIRRTQAAVAKLIDFGALCPMTASGAELVGTPMFTAPETLQRLTLDARTDLYSFGVTLYYALSKRVPYSARAFADLAEAWMQKPPPPSEYVSDIPPALDDLVLSLISADPALRPATAFEVMERLAACAGLRSAESDEVSRAYLSTPTLVGREDARRSVGDALRASRRVGTAGVIIQAQPGCGRSRLLDACALDAVTHGFTVARAIATGAREPFAVAQRLVGHLLETLPRAVEVAAVPELLSDAPAANDQQPRRSLRDLAELQTAEAQSLLRRFILGVSRAYPLLIAVDDVHEIDQPSAALLAELLDSTRRKGIVVLLTADSEATDNVASQALARRCSEIPLAPLTREQTQQLLGSLFGEVANIEMLSHEIHAVASGNPRQTLELAQHLIDLGLIRYTSGRWILPTALSPDDLPRSAADALHARIMRFSPTARMLAQSQALAFDGELIDSDYRALLPAATSRDVERAVLELLEAGAVLRYGSVYRLANRVWSTAFIAELDSEQTRLRHRALSALYADRNDAAFVHHAFAAGLDEEGLAVLERWTEQPVLAHETQRVRDAGRLGWCYPIAIETARRVGRSRRVEHDLRRWQYLASIGSAMPADRTSARA
jgi:serine/threonine-protein kinase